MTLSIPRRGGLPRARHVRPENRVHARLIARPRLLEPGEHVFIHFLARWLASTPASRARRRPTNLAAGRHRRVWGASTHLVFAASHSTRTIEYTRVYTCSQGSGASGARESL